MTDKAGETDLDDRVSKSRQISLTRPPELSSDLAGHYPYAETEQEVIKTAMREQLRQHEKGITPEDLFATIRRFAHASSGDLSIEVDRDGEIVRLQCSVTDATLEVECESDSLDVTTAFDDEE